MQCVTSAGCAKRREKRKRKGLRSARDPEWLFRFVFVLDIPSGFTWQEKERVPGFGFGTCRAVEGKKLIWMCEVIIVWDFSQTKNLVDFGAPSQLDPRPCVMIQEDG